MIMSDIREIELSEWNTQFDVDTVEIENSDVAQVQSSLLHLQKFQGTLNLTLSDSLFISVLICEVGLDRISTALEGNKIFIKLFSEDRIPVWIQSDNWKLRALSLTALTQISEGCKALLVAALDQVGDPEGYSFPALPFFLF